MSNQMDQDTAWIIDHKFYGSAQIAMKVRNITNVIIELLPEPNGLWQVNTVWRSSSIELLNRTVKKHPVTMVWNKTKITHVGSYKHHGKTVHVLFGE